MFKFKIMFVCVLFSMVLACGMAEPMVASDTKPLIQIFYKEKEASMQAYERIKPFMATYESNCTIQYLQITDPANADLMATLHLPVEHFPFAVAINGKTSANIDGKIIIFAHFPDFMHHIGRHQGNWTLEHLKKVLQDPSLLLPDNPSLKSNPGGQTEKTVK